MRNPDGTTTFKWVQPEAGLEVTSAAPVKEAKAPQTQTYGGRVWQFNDKTGKFDIPLGASEGALSREAAGEARTTARTQKEADQAAKAQQARQENDSQVKSAFAAMETALKEVENYSGAKAVTSPLEAANARGQYDAAAKAFAATLSRATGDTRISDSDRRAYAGLLTYMGAGSNLVKIMRPDLTRKRLEEAKTFFAEASKARQPIPTVSPGAGSVRGSGTADDPYTYE